MGQNRPSLGSGDDLRQLTIAGGLASLLNLPARSEAVWLGKPITLVNGYAPGGPTDMVARIVAEGLSRRLGQQVVVDPRSGASGTIAAAQVARAAPDGYTLIAIPGGHATTAALYRKLPYRAVEDFSMVSLTAEYPFVFVTNVDHPMQKSVTNRMTKCVVDVLESVEIEHRDGDRMGGIACAFPQYRVDILTQADSVGKPRQLVEVSQLVQGLHLLAHGRIGVSAFFRGQREPSQNE